MSEDNASVARLPVGIIVVSAAIIAVMWAALIFDIDRSGKAAIKQAGNDTGNLAMAFRENVERTVSAIDQLMIAVITEPAEFGKQYQIPAWVENSPLLRRIGVQVAIAGPQGMMIASTLGSSGQADISDRPYFKYHLDPAAPEPYISVPVIGRNSGKWSIQVTRRITLQDGSFGGVIVVSIDPSYFTQFFNDVDLGQYGAGDLVGRDGIVRARRAHGSQEVGQYVGDTVLFKRAQASSTGTAIVRSRLDGVTRVFGYAAVPDYPLVVIVGLGVDDVLAPARRQRGIYLALGGFLTLIIVSLSWFLGRETKRRRERELAAIAAEKVREQKVLLDTAVNNMRHGLLMFDRDGRAVVINRSYVEMYRLSPETAKAGCTLRDLLAQRIANGTFSDDIDNIDYRLDEKVFGLPDGRSIHVKNRYMDDGGWVSIHEDVTQKRRAEATLEAALASAERAEREATAAHARLRDAFEVVPEGLALFDADDRYVMWNRRYAELYSLDRNVLEAGRRFEDALRAGLAAGQYSEALGREQEWLAERLALHARVNSIHEQRLPNNRWLQICERRTADGGSVGIRIDITELKQREESVRMLFEFNPVPMFVVDCEDLQFLAVNDTAIRHYGYSREQFLAMTKLDIHVPEDRERFVEIFSAFRESERSEFDSAAIRRHRKAGGEVILVQVYGRRLNYNGRNALLYSIIDITERVQAEQERDRNRELLDRIVDNVPVTIIVKDARNFHYVLINKAAEKLWGVSRNELLGKTLHEVFDKEQADAIDEYDRQVVASGSNLYSGEHKLLTPRNGERVVTSNRIVIKNHNGEVQYLLGVLEDMTERKAVEDQLRQAQKMEAIGNLTGGVAHDFNNLLTIIMCNLDLLLEDVFGNAAAEEKIKVILEAADRGADLTRHMLAFSHRQPLQAKEVDVNALITTTMRLLDRTLGENIAIEVHTTADSPIALVDPSQLETALMNIAINARDAMPNGGTLTISTGVADLDEAYAARHPGITPGAYVSIAIADSGLGMPPETLEHIFEPFFTTKAAGQGTGLGLSMVYGFIKQSGGHINVYSEVGRGTIFRLFLPLAKSAAAQPGAQTMAPRALRSSGHEAILAVEDNPDIRATVVRQLRDLGYRVQEADSAEAALQILDSEAVIDLLFTDMIMPGGLNGKELATKARAKRADLKVLFTSGFPGASASHGAQLEPGDVLLSKPYHKRDLAKAVEDALSTPAPGIVPEHVEAFPTSDADLAPTS